jgi:hypothetical protein
MMVPNDCVYNRFQCLVFTTTPVPTPRLPYIAVRSGIILPRRFWKPFDYLPCVDIAPGGSGGVIRFHPVTLFDLTDRCCYCCRFVIVLKFVLWVVPLLWLPAPNSSSTPLRHPLSHSVWLIPTVQIILFVDTNTFSFLGLHSWRGIVVVVAVVTIFWKLLYEPPILHGLCMEWQCRFVDSKGIGRHGLLLLLLRFQ